MTVTQPFDSDTGLTRTNSEVSGGNLQTASPNVYSRTTSTLSGSGTAGTLTVTHDAKPGGTQSRIQFSDDGTNYTDADGDYVDNPGGYSFDGVDDTISFSAAGGFLTAQAGGDLVVRIRFKTSSTGSRIIPLMMSTSTGAFLYIDFNYNRSTNAQDDGVISVGLRNGNSQISQSYGYVSTQVYDDEWHEFVWVKQANTVFKHYFDGVPLTTNMKAGANFVNANMGSISNAYIASNVNVNLWFPGEIDQVELYTGQPTDQAVEDAYLSSGRIAGVTIYADYRLESNANDSSGNGYDGSVIGATAITDFDDLPPLGHVTGEVETLLFDGVNDVTSTVNVGNIRSVAFWICPKDTDSQDVIDLNGTAKITINGSDQITATGFTSPTYYVDGVSGGRTLTAGKWHHVTITDTADISATAVRIGYAGTTYGNFRISNVGLFSSALSSGTVSTDYANGWLGTTDALSIWPLDSDADDAVGSDDLTVGGATWIVDALRPAPASGDSTAIDVSGLAIEDDFYWKSYLYSRDSGVTPQIDLLSLTGITDLVPSRTLLGVGV